MMGRNKNLLLLLILIICWISWNCVQSRTAPENEQLEMGKEYHGFILEKIKKINELNAVGYRFEHVKSGARLLKLKTIEDNSTFCILFKTPPRTDSGTPHIMEHSVLNGSRKYPVKSPFDILKKGSMNTYLNALTGSHRTSYVLASRNAKAFFNFMDVYLDAVFYPRIYEDPRILQREGWHYELDDKEGELKINGIVYNEEQGMYSNPMHHINYFLSRHLFPDNAYAFASGGHPDAIPELTLKRFLDFHRTYYHPSNSYIFIEGRGDTRKELKFIDEQYLSKFNRRNVPSRIPLQKAFDQMKEVTEEYPISIDDSETDNTWLAVGFASGLLVQRDVTLGMEVLSDVLLERPAAPLRRALMDAGIGKEVIGSLWKNKQNMFLVGIQKANEQDKEKFKQIVFNTLKQVVEQGLDKKMIEGAINRLEFRLRENQYPWKGYPTALLNSFLVGDGWMFADDPFLLLEYERPLQELKEGLKTRYFEELIETYLLNNNHCLLLVMKPQKGLAEEKKQQQKEKLALYKASLSDEELEKLVNETKALKEYGERPDSPADLKKIPLLSLTDVDPKPKRLETIERRADGIKILIHPVFTNNIIYTRFVFDASAVPQELIPYITLLSYILGQMSTTDYTYGELDTGINLYTGGIQFAPGLYAEKSSPEKLLPTFETTAKVLPEKMDKLLELQGEIIKNTIYDDPGRLKELIIRLNAQIDGIINAFGLHLALVRLNPYVSSYGKYMELTGGLTYCHFISDIARDFDKKSGTVITNLQKVSAMIFNKSGLTIALTCPEKDYRAIKHKIPVFLAYVGSITPPPAAYAFDFREKNEGLMSSSRVQYVTAGCDYKKAGYVYSGKFKVLEQILTRDYLHRKIRVLGGAYGREASFSRDGFAYFSSYRDPQLEQTLQAYRDAPAYLENFNPGSGEMIRYILGTISRLDPVLTPEQEGNLAISNYFLRISHADIQKERLEVLRTTRNDIRKMAEMVKDMMNQNIICVYGNEKRLQENKRLFQKLVKANR
jgi:Zn-dependent M16 (insulinase) family peptidase